MKHFGHFRKIKNICGKMVSNGVVSIIDCSRISWAAHEASLEAEMFFGKLFFVVAPFICNSLWLADPHYQEII
jgi:hypothetical protein